MSSVILKGAFRNRMSFKEPIVGENIALVLNRVIRKKEALEHVPAYLFDIVLHDGTSIGQIDLRVGVSRMLIMYGGQVGYGINKPFRGNGYAAEACVLLISVAKKIGYDELWITCNPENIASIRTCEKIGAKLIERVNVSPESELWQRGDREKLRFLWQL